MEHEKSCVLVIIGTVEKGNKELVGLKLMFVEKARKARKSYIGHKEWTNLCSKGSC